MELEFKAKQGQSVFDVSNILLYGMDNIVNGLLKPSSKTFISILTNDTLIYNNDFIQNNTIQLELFIPSVSSEYKVTGLDNQSTFDLCIMNYANLDKLLTMIQENTNIVSINDIDVSLKVFNFNEKNLTEAYVTSIIKKKRYSFATIDKSNMGNIVWDGVFDIWDGVFDLEY